MIFFRTIYMKYIIYHLDTFYLHSHNSSLFDIYTMQNFHNGYYSQPNHYSYFNQIIFQISLMFSRYHRDYVWCFVIENKGQDGSMR
jgi:hypothetical protein